MGNWYAPLTNSLLDTHGSFSWLRNVVFISCRVKNSAMDKLIVFIGGLVLSSFALNEFVQRGTASYYAPKFEGRRTASGEVFRQDSLTAAHRSLPFGTLLRVQNLKNDSVVIVKVNDRIGRSRHILDLSLKAAKKLNFVRQGFATVTIEKIITNKEDEKN